MSSNLVEMQQPFECYRGPEFGFRTAHDMSDMYTLQEGGWPYTPGTIKPYTLTTGFIDFSNSKTPSPNTSFRPSPLPKEDSPQREDEHFQDMKIPPQRRYSHLDAQAQAHPITQPLEHRLSMYPGSSVFTASNAPAHFHDATTVPPLQTQFDPSDSSPTSNGSFSFDGQPQSAGSTGFMQFPTDQQQLPLEHRYNSQQTSSDSHSHRSSQSSAGRRCKSEYAEPGSARAIYLAKNRKAASKCRSKQKKQQEDLIDLARDVERRNRALKAEVDLLKGSIRELMGVVAQHTDCPDKRLGLYVQREADRLASGGIRTGLPSSPIRAASSADGT